MAEDQALQQLRAILARPEYQFDQNTSWWDQLLGFVGSLVLDLIAQVAQGFAAVASGRAGVLGTLALVVAVAVLVAVAVYLGRSIRLAVGRESIVRAATLAERRERSDRLWQLAQQQSAAGDWPAAARSAYLSALYALDEHALLHVESGLTNREHAVRLHREHPDVSASFAHLVTVYDRLRYGGVPITAAQFGELSVLVASARTAGSHP